MYKELVCKYCGGVIEINYGNEYEPVCEWCDYMENELAHDKETDGDP